MTPRILLLLLTAAALPSAAATSAVVASSHAQLLAGVSTACPRLRAPSTNARAQLVHIHTFEALGGQAQALCARYGVAEHRCGASVERELLATAHEMAALDVSEAVVNVTLDFSLRFSLTQVAAAGDETLVGTLTVLPEEPLPLTVATHCAHAQLGDAACTQLYVDIERLVAGIWGCANDTAEVTRLSLPLASDAQHEELALDAAVDVDLQVALFCRRHALRGAACSELLRSANRATRGLPAFERARERQRLDLSRVNVSSPRAGRLYPASSRVYLDFEPPRVNRSVDPQLCLFLDYEPAPALCSPELFREPKFFAKHSLPAGHHLLLFATLARDPVGAGRPLRAIADSEWGAAVHFDVAHPRVEIQRLALESVATRSGGKAAYLSLTLRTQHFDVADTRHRLCVLHNAALSCLRASALTVERDARADEAQERAMVLRAPVFEASSGAHEVAVLLLDEFGKAFALSAPVSLDVRLAADAAPLEVRDDDASVFVDPTAFVPQRPAACPAALRASATLRWICELWRHEWGVYSQNGEDGVLQAIFARIGVRHREFVEFGTEDGSECNTRFLREARNWTGLLMDGGFADPAINLRREVVTAANVNELFARHGVSARFDLLSVDVDFNDYWILDALDLARFAPRVIVCEYNSHVAPPEARAVRPDAARAWDTFSDYFGVSASALARWGTRRGYSLVYCESHGVNCFLVSDAALGATVSAVLPAADVFAPPNFFGKGWSYPNASRLGDDWVWL